MNRLKLVNKMKFFKNSLRFILSAAFFPFILLRETWEKKQGLRIKIVSSLILVPLFLIWGLGYLGSGTLALGIMANSGLNPRTLIASFIGLNTGIKAVDPAVEIELQRIKTLLTPSALPTINQQKLMEEINSWEVKQGYKPYVANGTLCYITDERLTELTKDWNTPKNYSKYDTRGEFSNITENVSKGYTPESTILQNWLNQYNTKKNLTDYFEDSCVRCSDTICVQLLGNLKQDSKVTSISQPNTNNYNTDPLTTCNIHEKCGGGSRLIKESECKNYYCCFLKDGANLLMTKEKCDHYYDNNPSSNTTQPTTQNTQKTQGNNVYCWNNTYGYGYYTTSGDQCNSDNLNSGVYKSCLDSQMLKDNACGSSCKSEADKNTTACKWAYTGFENAGIVQSSDKYGECLNGPGGVSEIYGTCLGKCTDQYSQDIKQCKP